MVFSETNNKNGIIQMIERLTKLGDGGISNDTVLLKQVTGDVNQAYRKVAAALLRVDKSWRWDDSNYSDFPIAFQNIANNQRDYTLPRSTVTADPSTLYKVNRIRLLYAGTYQVLTPMDADEQESDSTGVPTKYRLIGNSIRFNFIPSGFTTLTDAIEVQYQRAFNEFTYQSGSQYPGFPDTYHDLLAYDAAATYLLPYNPSLAITYSNIFTNRLQDLQRDWAERNTDMPRRLVPNVENTR